MRSTFRSFSVAASLVLLFAAHTGCSGKVDVGSHSEEVVTPDGGVAEGGVGADGGGGVGSGCGSRGLAPCAAGLACIFAPASACGEADRPGTCQARTGGCATIFAPVCSCDGKTHPNACAANLAGASVRHDGACVTEDFSGGGDACGSRGMKPCAAGYACIFPESTKCGAADEGGTCRKIDPAAQCPTDFSFVCSCDGKTYDNACKAVAAGASVASRGPCP